MYRAPRVIDVAMMAAVTMADHTAVDKRVTAARGDRLVGKTEDARRLEKATASRVAWVRHESRRGRPCGRAPRAGRSGAARYAHVPRTAEPLVRAVLLPLGDSAKDRLVTLVHSELSKGEGNSIN